MPITSLSQRSYVEEIGLLYRVKIHHQPFLTNPLQSRACFGISNSQCKYQAYPCVAPPYAYSDASGSLIPSDVDH